MATVELWHPELKVSVTVAASAVPHMVREGGWKEQKPKSKAVSKAKDDD